jgi:hypothetical protein
VSLLLSKAARIVVCVVYLLVRWCALTLHGQGSTGIDNGYITFLNKFLLPLMRYDTIRTEINWKEDYLKKEYMSFNFRGIFFSEISNR